MLAASMDPNISHTVNQRNCTACGCATFEANLSCHHCNAASEMCMVSGKPEHPLSRNPWSPATTKCSGPLAWHLYRCSICMHRRIPHRKGRQALPHGGRGSGPCHSAILEPICSALQGLPCHGHTSRGCCRPGLKQAVLAIPLVVGVLQKRAPSEKQAVLWGGALLPSGTSRTGQAPLLTASDAVWTET